MVETARCLLFPFFAKLSKQEGQAYCFLFICQTSATKDSGTPNVPKYNLLFFFITKPQSPRGFLLSSAAMDRADCICLSSYLPVHISYFLPSSSSFLWSPSAGASLTLSSCLSQHQAHRAQSLPSFNQTLWNLDRPVKLHCSYICPLNISSLTSCRNLEGSKQVLTRTPCAPARAPPYTSQQSIVMFWNVLFFWWNGP